MLVMARKAGERIICTTPSGEEIVVLIVRIGPLSVRVGVEAPDDVAIVREEIRGREVRA